MAARCCLLIGNSRWHWAEQKEGAWHFSHAEPDLGRLESLGGSLLAWAAVGPLPLVVELNPIRQLALNHVPLNALPPWLGIDRALGGWGALRRAQDSGKAGRGLLVADAGTVLSLTRVTGDGDFAGGQLVAGLRLQLAAMAHGTKDLNDPGVGPLGSERFPVKTSEAMRRGAIQALLGILLEAQRETKLPIWLCGGDAPLLMEGLRERGSEVFYHPDLVLEGMVDAQARISRGQGL